jgi:hypothetical protein
VTGGAEAAADVGAGRAPPIRLLAPRLALAARVRRVASDDACTPLSGRAIFPLALARSLSAAAALGRTAAAQRTALQQSFPSAAAPALRELRMGRTRPSSAGVGALVGGAAPALEAGLRLSNNLLGGERM